MTILALDPALVNTGVVVFRDSQVIHTETIKMSSEFDGVAKWMGMQEEYAQRLNYILLTYTPDAVASEYPHGSQSANAVKSLATVSGVISGLCTAHGIPCSFYMEYDVKRVLFGRSKDVTKKQMMDRVLGIFERFSYIPKIKGKPPTVNSFQHIADALGVLAIYLKQKGMIN